MSEDKKVVKKVTKAKKPDKVVEEADVQAEDLPTIVSVSMQKLPDMGEAGWVVLKIYSKGDKIVDIESSEPNLRAIAIEQLKIDVVKCFYGSFD